MKIGEVKKKTGLTAPTSPMPIPREENRQRKSTAELVRFVLSCLALGWGILMTLLTVAISRDMYRFPHRIPYGYYCLPGILMLAIVAFLFFHCGKGWQRRLQIAAFVLLLFLTWLTGNMVVFAAMFGPGYSYTTDPANYGLTDRDFGLGQAYLFPTEISDGVEIVRYSYYYDYWDCTHFDYYVELRFDDPASLEHTVAQGLRHYEGEYTTAVNPYDPSYTDCFIGAPHGYYCDSGDGVRLETNYYGLSYSMEERTLIITFSRQMAYAGEYMHMPAYLERFGVRLEGEWRWQ